MVQEVMGVEVIQVYDVCWIYVAQDSDKGWASGLRVEMCVLS